jgi:hypothetical protein
LKGGDFILALKGALLGVVIILSFVALGHRSSISILSFYQNKL